MFRCFTANPAHGNALDFSPLGKVGKLRRNEMSGARRCLRGRSQSGFGVRFYVIFADASARTCAFDIVDVASDFASQATSVGSGGNWSAVLRSSYLPQLWRHRERRGARARLIRRQSLFLGLAFSANGRLKRKTRSMLAGDVLHWLPLRTSGLGLRRRSALQSKDYLTDFDLLALFHLHFIHNATHRGRN